MKPVKDISVLIVDDYEINLQVLKLSIERFGVSPVLADDGQRAYEEYCKKPFDLVFMDLMMPGIDGYEATKKIRDYEKQNNLPKSTIIAVSANYIHDTLSNLPESGFNDLLPKPFNSEGLKAIISKYFKI